MSKIYYVVLEVEVGGYEKRISHFVTAADNMTAGRLALENECHNKPDWTCDDDSWQQCQDDYMVYSVYSATELTTDQVAAIKSIGISIASDQFPVWAEDLEATV